MLIQQIDTVVVDSTTEEEILERKKSATPGIGAVLGLFSLGATFGKSKRIGVSRTQREGLVQKLERVTKHLVAKEGLPDLTEAIRNIKFQPLDSIYYVYEGQFTVLRYDANYARIRSTINPEYSIELACSMKYFSDMENRNGRFEPHSGNVSFFEGRLHPSLAGVVIVQGIEDGVVHASPIYLALQSSMTLNL